MAIALDGTVVSGQASLTNVATSGALSATNATDIVVVDVFLEASGGQFVNVVAGTGLFFTRKSRNTSAYTVVTGQPTGIMAIERWWAATTSAFTSTISMNLNAAVDDWTYIIYCIKGVGNTGYPWDSNMTLPSQVSLLSATTFSSMSTQYTTFNTTDWALASWVRVDGATCTIAGYTSLALVQNTAGAGFCASETYYLPLSINTTNTAIVAGGAISNSSLATFDAVTTSSPGTPPPFIPGTAVVG